jgi:NADH-quinone oxidoreductase subunit J
VIAAAHNTLPDVITFVVAAAIILAGAVGVVTSRNPVHSALSLVGTLFGVAVLFVEENANFLAAVQVIVYAGAIVVLFLFVIMFLGVDRQESIAAEPLKGQRPLAIILSVVALGAIIALGAKAHWVTGAHTVTLPTTGPRGDVGQLGKSVFTTYLFAFEATAGLLVIAVVGAVVLARRPPKGTEEIDEEGQPSDEWAGGDPEGDGGDDAEAGLDPRQPALPEQSSLDPSRLDPATLDPARPDLTRVEVTSADPASPSAADLADPVAEAPVPAQPEGEPVR